ncbi:MAG: hypothetical protein WCG75_05200 [Armatimonadota bacterium]
METPPDYSQYARPGQPAGPGGGGRGYRGPGVYFDFITDAFNMVKNNLGVYLVATLITFAVWFAVQFPLNIVNNMLLMGNPLGTTGSRGVPQMNYTMLPVVMIIALIPAAVQQMLMVGISMCALEEADSGQTNINTMFSAFRNFLPVVLTNMLYILAIYIGAIFCVIPAFFVAGAFAFAPIISATEGLGPVQSMQKSLTMLKTNAWAMFGFLFVCSLLNVLGLAACCVGVLFTFPIYQIGLALHYREFRGPLGQGYVAPTVP